MAATATLLTRSIQGESLSAVTDRLANIAFKQGVIDFADDSFEVLEDTGSNMQIKVGSGTAFDRAVIEGDLAGQGVTIAEHQNASQILVVAAADGSNDRIDRVIVRVYDDTFDSSGNEYTDIEIIEGTPDASPVAPAEPASAYTLATILVQQSVSAITDSDITDLRFEAPIRGAFVETIVYTSNSSFVKADHPWLGKVKIRVQAGGGGGGSGAHTQRSGAGGGGGGYAEATVEEGALSASETVTVGTGGAGGAIPGANPGGDGNDSSFGTHAVADNGVGGLATGGEVIGGPGGVGTTGDVKASGSDGETASGGTQRTNGGAGGSSMLGGGGRGGPVMVGTARTGQDGKVYGGGGGGGANTTADAAGGAGADGIVIVDLYA